MVKIRLVCILFSCFIVVPSVKGQVYLGDIPSIISRGDSLSIEVAPSSLEPQECYVEIWQASSRQWCQIKKFLCSSRTILIVPTDTLSICQYSRLRIRVGNVLSMASKYFEVRDAEILQKRVTEQSTSKDQGYEFYSRQVFNLQ